MDVTLGLTNSKFVEIKAGLREGEQVIYAGYEGLTEGAPVVPTKWGPAGPLTLPPATGETAAGAVYTCPMHPEIRQDHPGDCPKCGMRLQAVPASPVGSAAPGAPASDARPATTPARPGIPVRAGAYTCPMHPQIVRDHPGKCPICHMDLTLKRTTPAPARGGMPGMGGMK